MGSRQDTPSLLGSSSLTYPEDTEVSRLADDPGISMLQLDMEEMIRRKGWKTPRIVRPDKTE